LNPEKLNIKSVYPGDAISRTHTDKKQGLELNCFSWLDRLKIHQRIPPISQAMAQHKLLNDQTLERQKLSQKGEELKHQVEEYKKAKQQVDEIMKGIAFYNKEIPERRA
jgi:hypothetical protein